jgi:hypothetical protein
MRGWLARLAATDCLLNQLSTHAAFQVSDVRRNDDEDDAADDGESRQS